MTTETKCQFRETMEKLGLKPRGLALEVGLRADTIRGYMRGNPASQTARYAIRVALESIYNRRFTDEEIWGQQ